MKKQKKLKQEEEEVEIKKQSTFNLQLSRFELLHIRDLMSVLLPPTGAQTLSQSLATIEDRNLIESILWEKVAALCVTAELPVDGEAPDYIIAPTAPPPMGVFQINQDLQQPSSSSGFLPEEQDQPEE